jgi:hypothetical protein
MKSSIVESSLDKVLNIQGEKWEQGQKIQGDLTFINKSNNAHDIPAFQIMIAYVDNKKFKALEENSFKEIYRIDFKAFTLSPKESHKIPWEFQLDNNAYISDKKHSLYILWGDLTKKIPPSLMLNVEPHINIKKIIEYWEVFFRFIKKDIISLPDSSLEIKLNPPASKEFATLDHLKLKLKREPGQLQLLTKSSLKTIKADTSGMSLAKSEKKVEMLWDEKKYLLMPGHLNQDFVGKELAQLLVQIK